MIWLGCAIRLKSFETNPTSRKLMTSGTKKGKLHFPSGLQIFFSGLPVVTSRCNRFRIFAIVINNYYTASQDDKNMLEKLEELLGPGEKG